MTRSSSTIVRARDGPATARSRPAAISAWRPARPACDQLAVVGERRPTATQRPSTSFSKLWSRSSASAKVAPLRFGSYGKFMPGRIRTRRSEKCVIAATSRPPTSDRTPGAARAPTGCGPRRRSRSPPGPARSRPAAAASAGPGCAGRDRPAAGRPTRRRRADRGRPAARSRPARRPAARPGEDRAGRHRTGRRSGRPGRPQISHAGGIDGQQLRRVGIALARRPCRIARRPGAVAGPVPQLEGDDRESPRRVHGPSASAAAPSDQPGHQPGCRGLAAFAVVLPHET